MIHLSPDPKSSNISLKLIGMTTSDKNWFNQSKFGLFVHWGLYAISGVHEQVLLRANLPPQKYFAMIDEFSPKHFDPHSWIDLAQSAGMEYLVFTTKHHDGFCLWDTKETRFNVMNSPMKVDVLRALADACHLRKFPLCLYYSIVDWHHPNYPNQGRSHELQHPKQGDAPDKAKYMDYLRAQVMELCTNYGPIQGFWWDQNTMAHQDPSINALIRRLQPTAMINDRGFDQGDFGTPERNEKLTREYKREAVEACNSVGRQSWGYRVNEDYYSVNYLKRYFASYLAQGNNFLLNVGPDADGRVPGQAVALLQSLGKWYREVKPIFAQAVPVKLSEEHENIFCLKRGNQLVVVSVDRLDVNAIYMNPIDQFPRDAILANSGTSVDCRLDWLPARYHTENATCLRLYNLPQEVENEPVLIFLLEFDRWEESWFVSDDVLEEEATLAAL